MADIELVIKLPEKWFDDMVKEEFEDVDELCAVIQHGTPLPKGHGRLIDISTIQSMAKKKAEDRFPEGRYDNGYRHALFEFVKDIGDAPTIIEADKEMSE